MRGAHAQVEHLFFPLRLDDEGFFHWNSGGKRDKTRPRWQHTNCLVAKRRGRREVRNKRSAAQQNTARCSHKIHILYDSKSMITPVAEGTFVGGRLCGAFCGPPTAFPVGGTGVPWVSLLGPTVVPQSPG